MALKFQPPNINMPDKVQALNDTLGSTVRSLPQMWAAYKIQRMEQDLKQRELEAREREYKARFGTGEPAAAEETNEQKLSRLGSEGYKVLKEDQYAVIGPQGIVRLDPGVTPYSMPGGQVLRDTFFLDPGSKQIYNSAMQPVDQAPTGAIIKMMPLSPETMADRELAKKTTDQARRIGEAINKLAVINKQFKEALPAGDKTPLEQRIGGRVESIKAKLGLTKNDKLVALQRNIRPIAINMIRLFGEVGNLAETEQKGAIDVVSQADLTDEERIAQTRQFIEFALAGANPDALKMISERKDVRGILDAFGVDLNTLPQPAEESTEIPTVGGTFEGKKVTKVTRIQ